MATCDQLKIDSRKWLEFVSVASRRDLAEHSRMRFDFDLSLGAEKEDVGKK